ncbi:MAG TPA: RsmB/NOP family class I SAM-dependent RNA methyltransferase [Rhodothermales bacterium]
MTGQNDAELGRLPEDFLLRLRRIVPSYRLPDVLRSFTLPSAVGFRVNTLRSDRQLVLASLAAGGLEPHPVPWWDQAFWLPSADRDRLLASEAYRSGHIYVQNLSSMIPPLVLDPQPGERVLDLTAAPGSKTLQIAGLMNQEGEIAAVELVRARFFKLRDNLRRQGADRVRTFLQDGERVWRYRPEHFDRVLLDAPCSSEGRFQTADADSYRFWSPRKIAEMTRKQRRLVFSGINALRPGGRLVYSTCAFAPEENEGAIAHALETFGDAVEVEPIDLQVEARVPPLPEWDGRAFPAEVQQAMRILPDGIMEGFFVCSLRKHASTVPASRR